MGQYTVFDTPVISMVGRLWARVFLGVMGWKQEGDLPDLPKFVMIAAPHTTNWDLPIMLAFGFLMRARLYYMMKDSVFRFPFRHLLMWLGGIPVDRARANGMVGQSIETFGRRDGFILVVPPEGTRSKVGAWKSGFYHIAVGAGVPIALGFLDYKRRRGGVGGLFHPTGDYEKDLAEIQAFYRTVTAKYPRLTALNDPADE
jgi:1-acyl-sn-glycerol-3-phosphate acyltransferase